jgi:membrane-associated HD superfamily phosphohydrolase
VKRIFKNILQTLIIAFIVICTGLIVQAQIDASTESGRPRKEELPLPIQETLAKLRIEDEKKDYEKLIERGEEAVKLSEELEKSYTSNNKLTTKDAKKLKDLEKLLKKIRSDLGGDDDDEEFEEKPTSMGDAIKELRKNTLNLFDEIKQTSRHTISVVAIESSNVILKIVKFLRFGN